MGKVEKRLKKDEKLLVCYNCGGRGHTSGSAPVSRSTVGQGSLVVITVVGDSW